MLLHGWLSRRMYQLPLQTVGYKFEFEKKKGALRNEDMKKTSPFSLDDDEKVRPVIMLDDIETLGIDEDGNFCRADLKTYCDGLLQQIYSDIYPISNE